MKTSPQALRRHADLIAQRDDPDTTTALRWAADDIEALGKLVRAASHALKSYAFGNASPDLATSVAEKLDRTLAAARSAPELDQREMAKDELT
jgi:hypothetical protein